MKKTIFVILGALAIGLSACGKKDEGGGNVGPTPPQFPGQYSCQAGYVFTQQGCLPQGSCQPGYGQNQYGQCIPAINPGGTQYTSTLFSPLGITYRNAFESLLEFSGRCVNSDGWLYGSNRCSLYSDQGYIQILANSTTVQDGARVDVLIVGGVNNPQIPYRYSSSWGGWVIYPIPMLVPMTYRAINNNQGFVLQDMGNFGYPSGRFRVTVANGQFNATSLNAVVSYNGTDFANASLVRQ